MASALNVLQTSHAYSDVMIVSRAAEVTKVRTSSKYQTLSLCYFVSAHTLNQTHLIDST